MAALIEVSSGVHPELTARENIWLYGQVLGMQKAENRRRFDEIVEFAELGHVLDAPVKQYSSGCKCDWGSPPTSSITLQHMPRLLIRSYLREFLRVLRPQGALAFQLPDRAPVTLTAIDLLASVKRVVTQWAKLKPGNPLYRLWRFSKKPLPGKMRSLRIRLKALWSTFLPWLPLPARLPFGGWWLAWNDACGDAVFCGNFETAECSFVGNFLTQGMTVLDVGAHHGFYTLLAARRVGMSGKVVAFEPSPRERRRLLWHLRLNRCANVQVEGLALGSYEGASELYVVKGRDTGCNSLRPPSVTEPTGTVRVPVLPLDAYLQRQRIDRVDFIKMDVEGAELEVLRGARELLRRRPRPVWLVEVQDVRTQPWGYRAAEIVEFLRGLGYQWFAISHDGTLATMSLEQECFDCNLLAVPETCLERVRFLATAESNSLD